jgi:hypothetical protein
VVSAWVKAIEAVLGAWWRRRDAQKDARHEKRKQRDAKARAEAEVAKGKPGV